VNLSFRHLQLLTRATLATVLSALLIGCGSGGTLAVTPVPPIPPPVTTYSGVTVSGTVLAGAQPVVGASVQIYSAGTTGNGSAGTALLTTALTTDTTGSVTIPAGYTCPAASSQIYLVARDGKIGTGSTNSAIAFLTTLGACNQVVSGSRYVLNEVSTVANVWAFSQFLASGGNIGASATNTVGIANAAATAASLANPTTGKAPGATFPANATSVAPRINSLANLLNTCTSSTSSSTACSTLTAGLANADTLDSALNIVRNAASNVAALYTQSTASTAFSPVLTAAPSDWTLFINFTGGGMKQPTGLGVDSKGNVWVSSYFSASNTDPSAGSATQFSPIGKANFPSGITGYGLSNIYGLAVDASDNVWIPNQASSSVNNGLGSVTVLNSSGQPLSGATGYFAGGIWHPSFVSVDTDGSVWVVNNGNSSITRLNSSGQPLSGANGLTSPLFAFPVAMAIDGNHNGWAVNQGDVHVTKISADGTQAVNYTCCNSPAGIAFDQSGNAWVSNFQGFSVSEISSAGVILSNGTYTANGTISYPQAIAVDGAGNVWVGNFRATYLTELAGASSTNPGAPLSPTPGWAPDSNLFGAFAAAVDPSGNLWITNSYSDTLTEFVGIAGPVKTPLLGLPQAP